MHTATATPFTDAVASAHATLDGLRAARTALVRATLDNDTAWAAVRDMVDALDIAGEIALEGLCIAQSALLNSEEG